MSKYNLHDTAFVFNLFAPLVAAYKIKGLIEDAGIYYYTCDGKNWIKEEYLYENELLAYGALIAQAEKEAGIINPLAERSLSCREESMAVNAEMNAFNDEINE